MQPVLGETIYLDFITSSSTGAAADADLTPTCEVFEDATDSPTLSPTVTKRTSKTGNYRVPIACTSGNGFEAGKSYNVVVSATVGGVAAKAVVGRFQVRAYSTDDVRALAASIASEVSAILDDTGTSGVAIASGAKTGMKLASDGLDAVTVESGINGRQAMAAMLSALAGVLSGAGTGTITIKGGGNNTTRITATTDSSGNRSAITLSLPS